MRTVFTTRPVFNIHDDVIKWKHLARYWYFVWGIHWSPVNSPHKGQWRGALMFSISTWTNDWLHNRDAGDLGRSLWRHCNVTGEAEQIDHLVQDCSLALNHRSMTSHVDIICTIVSRITYLQYYKLQSWTHFVLSKQKEDWLELKGRGEDWLTFRYY